MIDILSTKSKYGDVHTSQISRDEIRERQKEQFRTEADLRSIVSGIEGSEWECI